MPPGADPIRDLPELAAIGRDQLNAHCQVWLTTPAAKEFAVTVLYVDEHLRFHPTVTLSHSFQDGEDVIMPIDEVLHYIVDRHFRENQRASLHKKINENRRRSGDAGRIYRADLGEKFTLYLTCENPACNAELKTPLKGYLGARYTCEPTEATCPRCGNTYKYDGADLHFIAAFGY